MVGGRHDRELHAAVSIGRAARSTLERACVARLPVLSRRSLPGGPRATLPGDARPHSESHRHPDRPACRALVRNRICRRPWGRVLAPPSRGALPWAGSGAGLQRHAGCRHRCAYRWAALPRHRPVAALQERSAFHRPAALLGPRRLWGPADRNACRRCLCPLEAAFVGCLGGHRCAEPVPDAGDRALGQFLQPGAVFHGESPFSAAIARRAIRAPPTWPRRRPTGSTSSRCSCTSRCPASWECWSCCI